MWKKGSEKKRDQIRAKLNENNCNASLGNSFVALVSVNWRLLSRFSFALIAEKIMFSSGPRYLGRVIGARKITSITRQVRESANFVDKGH